MGLTDWRGWQPNSGRRSVSATSSIGFPMTACGERRRMASGAFRLAASTCRTSASLGRPTCRPGSWACVWWSGMIDGWSKIEAKGYPTCATYIRKPKARPPSAPCSALPTIGPATSRRSPASSPTSSRRSCATAWLVRQTGHGALGHARTAEVWRPVGHQHPQRLEPARVRPGDSQAEGSILPTARRGRRLNLNRQQSGGCQVSCGGATWPSHWSLGRAAA
jgi:hypothetical protein